MQRFSKLIPIINAYLPPLLWASLIFILSDQNTLPGASSPVVDLIFKQSAHTFVYAVLHFLIWRINKKQVLAPILITLAYTLTDEFHQSFIPGRTATWIDIGFDLIGISISHYLTHRQKELHSNTK